MSYPAPVTGLVFNLSILKDDAYLSKLISKVLLKQIICSSIIFNLKYHIRNFAYFSKLM